MITAYAGLPLWNTHLGVTVGRLKAKTRLDKSGAGANGGVKFKVLNGDLSGIVQSDRLEVELTFSGPEWAAVIHQQLKVSESSSVPLEVSVDDAVHASSIPLKTSSNHIVLGP